MINIPAFGIADYRNLSAGTVFNQQGMSGEQVALGLRVFHFTHSSAWVGVMLAVYFLLFFVFGIVSGVGAGAAAASDILTQSMMQLAVPNALRCRAPGVWVLAIGFGPLGHLEMGDLAKTLGLGPALFTNSAALVVVSVIVANPRWHQL